MKAGKSCQSDATGSPYNHRFRRDPYVPFAGDLDSVTSVHLPHIRGVDFGLVLDYVYTGAMFLTLGQLPHVVRVMEMLDMKCGVSVSKMVVGKKKRRGSGGGGGAGEAAASVAGGAPLGEEKGAWLVSPTSVSAGPAAELVKRMKVSK